MQTPDEEAVESLYLYEQTRSQGISAGKTGFGSDPAAQFLSRIEGEQVVAALRALPPEFRAVCTLYFVHEMSYEQIAAVVECPLNTVRSRLHRGRKYLQKALWDLAQEHGLLEPGAASSAPPPSAGKGSLRSWLVLAASGILAHVAEILGSLGNI